MLWRLATGEFLFEPTIVVIFIFCKMEVASRATQIIMTPNHLRSNVRTDFGFGTIDGKIMDRSEVVC